MNGRALTAVSLLSLTVMAGCFKSTIRATGTPAPEVTATQQHTGPTGLPSQDVTTVPAGPPELSVKDDLAIEGDDGTRATVHISSVRAEKSSGAPYADKPAHGTYIVVDVTVTVTAGTLPVNPLYSAYQAPDGSTFHADDGNAIFAGFEPALDANDVPRGQRVRGNVVFDAPWGRGAKLQYESPGGEIIGVWTLST